MDADWAPFYFSRKFAYDAEFDESKIKRDDKGRFTKGGAGGGKVLRERFGKREVSRTPQEIFAAAKEKAQQERERKRKQREARKRR